MSDTTLFIRLEGPLQAWGSHESKFAIRRIMDAPTKSGLIGLFLAAKGISRIDAAAHLPHLNQLKMGVRIDRPGIRWWDYHTVGAKQKMQIAEAKGKSKMGALLSRREYLCDASFLVAVKGDPSIIEDIRNALTAPIWTLFLGRKCCVPSRPLLDPELETGSFSTLLDALCSVPWKRRLPGDVIIDHLDCVIEWEAKPSATTAPLDAEIWYDVPESFDPPSHRPRFVTWHNVSVGENGVVKLSLESYMTSPRKPSRPSADYSNSQWRIVREQRLQQDHHLCVFCKAPATTVQHCTYRHAGGDERLDELRSLCRLCHDAVTMIEYGENMGLDRINPEDPKWRDRIIQKRDEIVQYRSLETRRRKFDKQEDID